MQPWEVDHIDQTFKDAADNARFPYQSQDWQALEHTIRAKEAAALRTRIGIVLATIGLLVTGYFLVDLPGMEEEMVVSRQEQSQTGEPARQQKNLSTGEVGLINSSRNRMEQQEADRAVPPTKPAEPSSLPPVSKKYPQLTPPLAGDTYLENELPTTIIAGDNQGGIPNATVMIAGKESPFPAMTYQSYQVGEMNPLNIPSPMVPVVMRKKSIPGKWSLGVGYVRDNSGISFEGTKGGHGLSLSASYQLSNRFSLQTGVTKLHKTYEITKGLEHYPELWDDVQIPLHILAESLVIEIPLNIRMNLVGSAKNNLFISTGLSSYFMLEEDYIFGYHYSEGPNAIPGIEVKGGNNHIFSIYNLSLGFQRRITRNLAIEIEPYLRLPFAGIGIWDVNLTSSGTHITARYFFR